MALQGLLDATSLLGRAGSLAGHALASQPLDAIRPVVMKLPPAQEEDQSAIATLFGIPIGFQFGTAMGMKGIPALAVDILTDPLNLVAFPISSLTKAGRAARIAGKLSKTEQAMGVLAKSRGLTREAKLAEVSGWMANKARLETAPFRQIADDVAGKEAGEAFKYLQDMRRAATKKIALPSTPGRAFLPNKSYIDDSIRALEQGGTEGLQAFLGGQIARRQQLQSKALELAKVGNFEEFKKVADEIGKLRPSKAYDILYKNRKREWAAFFDESAGGRVVPALAPDAASQAALTLDGMAAPQRALLQVRVPGTNIERVIAVGQNITATGAKALSAAAAAAKPFTKYIPDKATGLVPGARAAAARIAKEMDAPARLAGPDSVHATMKVAADAISGIDLPESELRFQNVADTLAIEKTRGKAIGDTAGLELRAALNAASKNGVATPDELNLFTEALQNKDKFFKRTHDDIQYSTAMGEMAPRKRWGAFAKKTGAYGDLTDYAKAAGFTDKHALLVEAVDTALGSAGERILRDGLVDALVEDYAPRVVKKVIDPQAWQAKFGSVKRNLSKAFSAHTKNRTIPLYDELLKLEREGIIELEKDPSVVLAGYFQSVTQAAADARFMRRVAMSPIPIETAEAAGAKAAKLAERANSHIGKGFMPSVLPDIEVAGKKGAFIHKLKASGMYERVTDPSILDFAHSLGTKAKQKNFYKPSAVWVLKDMARPLRAVVERGAITKPTATSFISDRAFAGALAANALMKRSLLSFSSFHYMALTESAIASSGVDFFRQIPNYARMMKEGKDVLTQRHFFDSLDVYDEALKAGLTLDPPLDAEMDTFTRAMKWVGEKLSVPAVTNTILKVDTAVNGRLWYYHRALKFNAFSELYAKGLSHYADAIAAGKMRPAEVAKGVAHHINTSFGGQTWERFLISKRGQQWMRLLILAPDWTASNLLIAKDVFANWFLKNEMYQKAGKYVGFAITPEMVMQADVKQFFARQYAARSGLYLAGAAALANYAFSGHFIWDNAEGHKTHLELPWKDSKQRALYLDVSKQFAEPFELLASPFEFTNRKMGAFPRMAIAQVTGKDFFGKPIVTADDGPLANISKRLGYSFGGAVPLSLQEFTGMRDATDKDFATKMLTFTGLPVKTEFKRGVTDEEAAKNPVKTKQQLRAEVLFEVDKAIKDGVEQHGEAYEAAMKNPQYLRNLDAQMRNLLRPPEAQLAVAPL